MRTMIAVPCMDQVQTAFFRSCVGLQLDGEIQWTTCQSSLIYDARNKLAELALGGNFDRVLWLDSDMAFDDDLMIRLGADLDEGWDMVCGIYFKRRLPVTPVIYKSIDAEAGKAETYADYPRDRLFGIAGCGFGAVMMKVDMLRRMMTNPFTPYGNLSEDLTFCHRATASIGAKIGCDSRIKVGHVGQMTYGENMYRR